MEENDICIVSGKDYTSILDVLELFLRNNERSFDFFSLSENHKRITLWTALFVHLQEKSAESIHLVCLASLRILSRDRKEIDNLICEKWLITLIEKAGLYSCDSDYDTVDTMPSKEIAVEALKCLCNIAFNSEVARALCAHTNIAQVLLSRPYKHIPYKDDIMVFDIKLLFILTALRQDIRAKMKSNLQGINHLLSCLSNILAEAEPSISSAESTPAVQLSLNDSRQIIVCEILKTQFNMLYHSGTDESISPEDEVLYLKLLPLLTSLLTAKATSDEKLMDIFSNVANLLTSVPAPFYKYISPELKSGETAKYKYEGRNMEAVQSLLQLLEYRLDITTGTSNQYENLSPILTVLNKSSRNIRYHRKYLRLVVLPPLRDVHRPPEKGNTLRNQLCRLLTSPVTSVRDLVAEFLFILCKEKVGRMVKYTGFGNAAGHLAQKGLMSGAQGPVQYSSSSEDSDTEEYLEAQPNIDPVVGCTMPPRVNPFEGMTEEQKEFEAMKLVNLFDQMVTEGIVKPATIGPDGKPKPLEHILEIRESPPNRPQS